MVNLGREIYGSHNQIILVDGVWDPKTTNMGLGWCIRRPINHVTHDIHGGETYDSANSALHAEVLACIQALYQAQQNQLHHINLFTNSTNLVQVLQNHLRPYIQLIWTFEKLKILANEFTSCCITKVPYHSVANADKIAKKCLATMTFTIICQFCSSTGVKKIQGGFGSISWLNGMRRETLKWYENGNSCHY